MGSDVTDLDAWSDRVARRAARRPDLAEALLSRRPLRYALHRTRYLLLRSPLRMALHLLELVFLGQLVPLDELGPIFAIRAIMTLVASLHWGALEALREEVRDHARSRAWSRAAHAIELWITSSFDLGLLQAGVAVAWVTLGPSEYATFSIFDAYALAAGLRVAGETVARTYGAGIGALQRVPRPLWASVAGEIVDLSGPLVLWPIAGPWGFAVALLAGGVLRTLITLHFARRAYRASPLRIVAWRPPRLRVRKLGAETRRQAVRLAMASATTQLDAWILLAFAAAARTHDDAVIVAALHVLRPLLAASAGWSRLFYLDLKRVQFKGYLLQRRLASFLIRFGVTLALGASLLVLSAWPLLWGRAPDAIAWWLVPFFVARSIFSLFQVQAFSYGRVRYLLRSGAAVGLGLLLVLEVPALRQHALASISVLLALVAVIARSPQGSPRTFQPGVVGLYPWLAQISNHAGAGRIVSALVDRRLSVNPSRVAATVVSERGVAATLWGARHILWFEPTEPSSEPLAPALAVTSAGVFVQLREGPAAKSGRAALAGALDAGVLEPSLAERLKHASPMSAPQLAADFRRDFPEGSILDARHGRLEARSVQSGRRRSALEMRRALGVVLRLSGGPGRSNLRAAGGDLLVFAPAGEPEMVLVAPSDADESLRSTWRRRVEDATLAASTGVPTPARR